MSCWRRLSLLRGTTTRHFQAPVCAPAPNSSNSTAPSLLTTSASSVPTTQQRRHFAVTHCSSANSVGHSIGDQVPTLQAMVKELSEKVAARDRRITALEGELAALRASVGIGGTEDAGSCSTLVSSGDEFCEALQKGVSHIRLKANTTLQLGGRAEVRRQGQLHLSGEGGSVVVGNWRLRNDVEFTARDVHFVSPSKDEPCLEIIGNKTVACLTDCVVAGGREGVMLSSGATCNAFRSRFCDNVRGVFESFRCAFTGSECIFEENIFHLVLLSKPRHKERIDEMQAMGHQFIGQSTKGDLALSYNPVTDTYGDVVKEGRLVVLTPSESTTNLVDPSW